MKQFFRRLHLGIALIIGVFLLITSVSGALLIYAKDLQLVINPQFWQKQSSEQALPVAQLKQRVLAQTGAHSEIILIDADSRFAWQIKLSNGKYASVDPASGQVLHQYDYYQTLYGYTMSLHRWLLFQNDKGERSLRDWVSIVSTAFIVLMLIGFYLWARPKRRLKRLKVNFSAKGTVINQQLHHTVGVFCTLPLILIAFSGIAFNWKAPTESVVSALSPGQVDARPKAPKLSSKASGQPQLQHAINVGMRVFEGAQLRRIYLPKTAQDPLGLRMQLPGESHGFSWVWVNPYTGVVLKTYDARAQSMATRVWNFKYKFHIGDFAGPVVQVLWLILSLTPIFFVVTGLVAWRKRVAKVKR